MPEKMKLSEIKNHLEAIFGKEDVISDDSFLLAYSTDASQIPGSAKYVVFPHETDQIRRLILFASRYQIGLVPRGGGTGLVGGAVPNDDIVVDLSKMIRVSNFDKNNKIIWVEPGVILSKLNLFLKEHNLFFPVIPSSHSVCTIGGMAATDAVGLRAIRYGKTSDNILELELLDGSGKTHKITDLSVVGSEGIYGFITKIKLMLVEYPEQISLNVFEFDNLDELLEIIFDLKNNSRVTALEFIDKQSSKLLELEEKYHLIVEYDDDSGDIKTKKEIEDVWTLREGLRTVFGELQLDIIEDPFIPDDKLKEFIEWSEIHDVPCFGHIGVGILHLQFKSSQNKLIDKMLRMVISFGGDVTGEHGYGTLKSKFLNKIDKNNILAIKKKYDPHHIMNLKKVIGKYNFDNDDGDNEE